MALIKCPECNKESLMWETFDNQEVSDDFFYNNKDYILSDNKNGEKTEYDNNNELHRKFFKKYDWYHDENNEKWSPVDLHTQTTINAFGADIVNHKDFKHYRKYGKVCNFAK